MLSIPGALKVGAIGARDNLLAKNARWYVASADGIEKVGWGDLSVNDLELIGAEIGPRAFVAVTEAPAGFRSVTSVRWNWYDQPDQQPGPSIDDICSNAICAVVAEGGGVVVDPTFRTGDMIELHGGHRFRALNAADLRSVIEAIVIGDQTST